ncbi:MAG: AAA family ATPase [Spirochaetota bacterium]
MNYIPRFLKEKLNLYLKTFPAILITGPRQCGKSTLVFKELPGYEHFDLERPADFRLVTSDPELFFKEHPNRICIDEVQRFPDLFPVLRYIIDTKRENGRFVLLGSAGSLLVKQLSDTLAGRLGILELTPFLLAELVRYVPWKTRWWYGGLPPLYTFDSDEQRTVWLDN